MSSENVSIITISTAIFFSNPFIPRHSNSRVVVIIKCERAVFRNRTTETNKAVVAEHCGSYAGVD